MRRLVMLLLAAGVVAGYGSALLGWEPHAACHGAPWSHEQPATGDATPPTQ
jgi:hypothetical protein